MAESLPLPFGRFHTVRRARERGHAAADAAADRADRQSSPRWSDSALVILRAYCKGRSGEHFMAEDVVAYAKSVGLPDPPDRRAWGAVFQRAKREGVIVPDGFAGAETSNGSPKVRWRVA